MQSGRDLEVDFSQKQFKATELETLRTFLLVNTSFSLHTRKSCISSSHYTIYFYRIHIRLSYIRTRLCFPKTNPSEDIDLIQAMEIGRILQTVSQQGGFTLDN